MTAEIPSFHQVFLRPGELHVALEPTWVSTVLGSCVAVTLYHPQAGLAAICHAMLPEPGFNEPRAGSPERPLRFVSLAIPAMLRPFLARGIPAVQIEAKLFGGSEMLRSKNRDGPGIGASNITRARALLEAANITVACFHVGGTQGRKLRFNTLTGEVLLATVPALAPFPACRSSV